VNHYNTEIPIKTLIQDLSVRNFQKSLVSVFHNFHLLPSQINEQIQGSFDPLWSLCITPKYSQSDLEKSIRNYTHTRVNTLQFDSFGISSAATKMEKGPFELTTPLNNVWFHRLSALFREIDFLKKVPGVKNVYISGSILTSGYKEGGDADLIIEAKKNYVWFVRFVVKVLLKCMGKDVHSYRGQLLVSMSANFKIQKIFPQKWLTYISRYGMNMIQREKLKMNNIDVGLIFETGYDITGHYTDESQNWGILPPFLYHQEGYLEQVSVAQLDKLKNLSSLNFFEMITYPFALLAQFFSRGMQKKYSKSQYFSINSKIISFFPKIYKR
jgi:predicted nucleotidyltransferase